MTTLFEMEPSETKADLDALALHVCGTTFENSPTEWQNMVLNMVKRGVVFGVPHE